MALIDNLYDAGSSAELPRGITRAARGGVFANADAGSLKTAYRVPPDKPQPPDRPSEQQTQPSDGKASTRRTRRGREVGG